MELYINNSWTERYGNAYTAEDMACSENDNHATIYTVGPTAEEADAKLVGALRELKLMPAMSKNLMTRGGAGTATKALHTHTTQRYIEAPCKVSGRRRR